MTQEPEWLREDAVLAIHRILIAEHGGVAGVRDAGLLLSTLARPRNLFVYSERPTLFDLAASYAYGFARNHCFVDGNKRIALTAALTFLEVNGFRLAAPREEVFTTMTRLAAGDLTESELNAWLADHCDEIQEDE